MFPGPESALVRGLGPQDQLAGDQREGHIVPMLDHDVAWRVVGTHPADLGDALGEQCRLDVAKDLGGDLAAAADQLGFVAPKVDSAGEFIGIAVRLEVLPGPDGSDNPLNSCCHRSSFRSQ